MVLAVTARSEAAELQGHEERKIKNGKHERFPRSPQPQHLLGLTPIDFTERTGRDDSERSMVMAP